MSTAGRASGAHYDAFISYSHAADEQLAPALQSGLQRLARPFLKPRALKVFRDKTSLSASPHLWSSIEEALLGSRFFIYLASPEAAASPWVAKEIAAWKQHKSPATILIGLTGGDCAWDARSGDFDRARSNSIPEELRGAFTEEPLYVDLRWARGKEELSLRHGRFRQAVAELAAPIHGRPKDELESEDVRQHHRTKRLVRAGIGSLVILMVISVTLGALAMLSAKRADREAAVSLSRQLGAQARAALPSEPDLGMLLAVESGLIAETDEARSASMEALGRSDGMRHFLWGDTDTPLAAAFVDGSDPMVIGRRAAVRWGEHPATWELPPEREGRWRYAAMSTDGGTVALADDATGLTLWQPGSATEPLEIEALSGSASITSLAIDPAGTWTVAGLSDGKVRVFDTRDGSSIGALRAPGAQEVKALAVDPSGKRIAARLGTTLVLWDASGGGPVQRIGLDETAAPDTPALAFSSDGSMVAASLNSGGGDSGGVALVDLDAPRRVQVLKTLSEIASVAFGPDGSLAAGGYSGGLILWPSAPNAPATAPWGRLLPGHRSRVLSLAFDPNGDRLVSVSTDEKILWDIGENPHLTARSLDGNLDGNSFGVGLDIMFTGTERVNVLTEQGQLAYWDLDSAGQRLHLLEPPHPLGDMFPPDLDAEGTRYSGMISPDRSRAIYLSSDGSGDRFAIMQDFSSGRFTVLDRRQESGRGSRSATFLPDGRMIALGSTGGHVDLWDALTLRFVRQVAGPPPGTVGDGVSALASDPSGALLAVGYETGSVELLGLDGTPVETPEDFHLGDHVTSLTFSRDGRYLAAGGVDSTVEILDQQTGDVRGPIRVDGFVWDLAFDPESDVLAIASSSTQVTALSGFVSLWQLGPMTPIGDLRSPGLGDSFRSVAFAPDGSSIAAANLDGGITVWSSGFWDPGSTDEMRDRLCDIVGRRFTEDERRRFLPEGQSPLGCASNP